MAGIDVLRREAPRQLRPALPPSRRPRRRAGRALSLLSWVISLAALAFAVAPDPPPLRASLADVTARLDAPTNGATVSGLVEIRGRATTSPPEAFDFYRLYFGPGHDASYLRPIGPPFTEPVEDGVLATADSSQASGGTYVLLLRVYDVDGGTAEDSIEVTVAIQPTPWPFATVGAGDAPTPAPTAVSQPAPAPGVYQPPQLAPVLLPDFSAQPQPTGTLIPTIQGPTPYPIYPIPGDPTVPPPVRLAPDGPLLPGQLDPGQLPGAPPAVYLTPSP